MLMVIEGRRRPCLIFPWNALKFCCFVWLFLLILRTVLSASGGGDRPIWMAIDIAIDTISCCRCNRDVAMRLRNDAHYVVVS